MIIRLNDKELELEVVGLELEVDVTVKAVGGGDRLMKVHGWEVFDENDNSLDDDELQEIGADELTDDNVRRIIEWYFHRSMEVECEF